MIEFIMRVIEETIFFFNEVAIYLLFGFFVAGILHILFPDSIVRRHLGKSSLGSVLKSTAFGIPLPICSCGVVPVAASMKNSGASKGATISFLISTPQVGADSFMITYSLLGWVFAIFRIIASLITAILAGLLVNLFGSKEQEKDLEATSCAMPIKESFAERLKSIFSYVEYELLGSIANSLIIGILIAGIISALIPDGFFETYMGIDSHVWSMLLMLVIGIPLYVCASASTPIAASLILKGMSPGAALVFLLTGPATNAMSIAMVFKMVGKKATIIYLLTICGVSLILGFVLNIFADTYGLSNVILMHQHDVLPMWLKVTGSGLLILMLMWFYIKTKWLSKRKESEMANKISVNVSGMNCMHCANSVKKAVEAIEGTSNVLVDLDANKVDFEIVADEDVEKVKAGIVAAGYTVT